MVQILCNISKCIVVHWIHSGGALTSVDHANFSEVVAFKKFPYVDFFTPGIFNFNITVTFSNEPKTAVIFITLVNDSSVWKLQFCIQMADNRRQKAIHTIAELHTDFLRLIALLWFQVVGFFFWLTLLKVVIQNSLDCVSNCLVFFSKDICEKLSLHGYAQRVWNQFEKRIKLILQTHCALDFEEIVSNFILETLR